MNQGTSEGPETLAQEGSTRRIRFFFDYVFLYGQLFWKLFQKRGQNEFYRNSPHIFGFSLPRAFRTWSWICRSPFGSLVNGFFVWVHWGSNPAVLNWSKNIIALVKYGVSMTPWQYRIIATTGFVAYSVGGPLFCFSDARQDSGMGV